MFMRQGINAGANIPERPRRQDLLADPSRCGIMQVVAKSVGRAAQP